MLGKADGTFQPAVQYTTGDSGGSAVAIADFNGDHKLDLAVVITNCPPLSCGQGSVSILLGNGDGTFKAPLATPPVLNRFR
jgi:FG-GAP-like repeat